MRSHKQSLPKAKRHKRPPETDDEFLAEGVSLEEAGDKWRAGDAAKAARFYTRALELYDEALKLFPESFDLLYNKARVQYSITQTPAIRSQFPAPTIDLLQTALQSHRLALRLDSSNADLLFNTAQVLQSLAETIDDSAETIRLLQEAAELLEQCLSRQEVLAREHLSQVQHSDVAPSEEVPDQGGVSLESNEPPTESTSQWVTILEPVTQSSLLETVIAMLDTFASLCNAVSDAASLIPIGDFARKLLDEKVPIYLEGLDDVAMADELACADARFRAAFSEAEYRFRAITYAELDGRIREIFEMSSTGLEYEPRRQSFAFLVCFSDALVSFAIAGADEATSGILRFKRLTKALDCLEKAAKLPDAKDLASVHMGRGDAELIRYTVSRTTSMPQSLGNPDAQKTLLQNAVTFYRGSAATARAATTQTGGIATTSTIRQAAAQGILDGNNLALRQLSQSNIDPAEMHKAIARMFEESLIQEDVLHSLLAP